MSEGINFSDDLGRLVLIVGLPYPNAQSPELKEKLDYLNRTQVRGDGVSAPVIDKVTMGIQIQNNVTDFLCTRVQLMEEKLQVNSTTRIFA